MPEAGILDEAGQTLELQEEVSSFLTSYSTAVSPIIFIYVMHRVLR